MSSELHIPSIIRPHFDPPSDQDEIGEEIERKNDNVSDAHNKPDNNHTHFPKFKRDHAHVTFAPTVQAPSFERAKTIIPALNDSKLNVDHKHYEQWARNPNRKAPSTALYRGIQQLKAKKMREKEQTQEENLVVPEPYRLSHFSNLLRESTTVGRPYANSASAELPLTVRQKQVQQEEASFNKSLSSIRNILKPTQHTFDGVNMKRQHKKDNYEFMSEEMQKLNRKIEVASSQEMLDHARDYTTATQAKPRIGLSKIHDRNPFPVSINQPVCIGDHVFLVNEPVYFKSPETWRLKSRGSEMSASSTRAQDKLFCYDAPLSATSSQHLKPSFPLTNDELEHEDSLRGSLIHRAGTYFGSFLPKKSNRRIPAVISSAELYDFSQLAELRSLHEMKYMERTKTEDSIYLRGPKLTKLVPRAQRLSALLK